MKTRFIIGLAVLALLASCNKGQKTDSAQQDNEMLNATKEELVQAIAERDQLLELVTEIANTTNEIRSMENIVSINAGTGETAQGGQVNADLTAIKATLEERRQRIEELENKLKKSGATNSGLLATIDALKTQTANQAEEIEMLNQKLNDAHAEIRSLGHRVDALNTEVDVTRQERDQAETKAHEQELLANMCYYVIGTKKELKEHDIIEGGGFLRKDKILDGDFDKSFFVKADKRTLTTIHTYSKKAKVITKSQPKDSYAIDEEDGMKVLHILNPSKFWGTSNYLVIQVD